MKIDYARFQKINDKLFLCYEDENIKGIIQSINEEILKNLDTNYDLFFPYMFEENEFISLLLISFIANREDGGFICYLLPNFIVYKTNIRPIIKTIIQFNPKFQEIQITNGLKGYITSTLNQNGVEITCFEDDTNLIFSNTNN